MTSSGRLWPRAILALFSVVMLAGCSTETTGADNPNSTASSSAATPSLAPSTTSTPTPRPTTSSAAESLTITATTLVPTSTTTPSSQDPEPAGTGAVPTDLSGEIYGYIQAVDLPGSQLTVDKVDWFTGSAAEQACAEDGVPPGMHLDGWCSMYYFRNVNPALRFVSVSPSVAVTTLDGTVPVPGDLASLAARITTPTGSARPYRLTVTEGAVIEVMEIYQP
jgi:hypothetical protein